MSQDYTLLLSLVLALQIFIISNFFGIKHFFSPIYVVLYIYLIVGITGYLVYSINPDFVFSGSTSVVIKVTPQDCILILRYFLTFINQISFGALSLLFLREVIIETRRDLKYKQLISRPNFLNNTFSRLSNSPSHYLTPSQKVLEDRKPLRLTSEGFNPNLLILLSMVPTILLIVGVGPEQVLMREYYIYASNRFMLSLGNILILPSAMMLGYCLASKVRPLSRFACLLLIGIDFLTLFSLATRALIIFPFLITFGYWFNANRKKGFGIFLCFLNVLLFSPVSILPLYFRGLPSHGLLPYINSLSKLDLATLFNGPIGIISNILFSFPLTGEVISNQRMLRYFPIDYLLISINPLQGDSVGWENIAQMLRVNIYTPFNAISEMYLYGDTVSFFLFFSLGVLLVFISLVFQNCLERSQTVFALILLMLVFLFAIVSLQYNLRTATRILYLAFTLASFFGFINNTLDRIKQ